MRPLLVLSSWAVAVTAFCLVAGCSLDLPAARGDDSDSGSNGGAGSGGTSSGGTSSGGSSSGGTSSGGTSSGGTSSGGTSSGGTSSGGTSSGGTSSGGTSSGGSGGGPPPCNPPPAPACTSSAAKPLAWAFPDGVATHGPWLAGSQGILAFTYTNVQNQARVVVFDRGGAIRSTGPALAGGLEYDSIPLAAGPNGFLLVTDPMLRRIDRCGAVTMQAAQPTQVAGAIVHTGRVTVHRGAGGYFVALLTGSGAMKLGVGLLDDSATSAPSYSAVGPTGCCARREWGASAAGSALHAAYWHSQLGAQAVVLPGTPTALDPNFEPRWAGAVAGKRLVLSGDKALLLDAAGATQGSITLQPFAVDEFSMDVGCSFTGSGTRLFRSCQSDGSNTAPLLAIDPNAMTEKLVMTTNRRAGIAWDGEGLGVVWVNIDNKMMFQYTCGEP